MSAGEGFHLEWKQGIRTSLLVLMWPMSAATPILIRIHPNVAIAIWEELTGSKADIVESELANPGVELQQEGQWLTNTTSSTQNRHLGGL